MEKYLINHNVFGYNLVNEEEALNKCESGDKLYIVADSNTEGSFKNLYCALKALLKRRVRIYLINVVDTNTVFKPLASLVVSYDNYDIYEVGSKESIDQTYLNRITSREPDASEAMNLIDNSIMAYSEIATLMIGIESLVGEGNLAGLQEFIEKHLNSIENLSTAVDYMKKLADMKNSSELLRTIDKLKEDYKNLQDKLKEAEDSTREAKAAKEKISEDLNKVSQELTRTKSQNAELKEQASKSSGWSGIRGYTECNTSLIKCKTKLVLYFKEISYVAYTNSLMMALLSWMKLSELSCKMLIYDNQTELLGVYKPLNIVDGREYASNKAILLDREKAQKFVVVEPLPSILTDVLTSVNPVFDVVIVYDRMKGAKDLVSGNNVTKFYVVNSKKEYDESKNILKITDDSLVITRTDGTFAPKSLDIPFIDGYNTMSDSAKLAKYIKLATKKTGVSLIKTIADKSKVSLYFSANKR